jgi:hypothetical protein
MKENGGVSDHVTTHVVVRMPISSFRVSSVTWRIYFEDSVADAYCTSCIEFPFVIHARNEVDVNNLCTRFEGSLWSLFTAPESSSRNVSRHVTVT